MATAPTKPTTKKTTKASSKTTTKPSKKTTKTATPEVAPPQVEEKNTVSETQPVSTIAPDATTIESSLTENLTVLAESINR